MKAKPIQLSLSVVVLLGLLLSLAQPIPVAARPPTGLLGLARAPVLTLQAPDIELIPKTLVSDQLVDQLTTQTLQVCNQGDAPLDWSLQESFEAEPGRYILNQPHNYGGAWVSDASCDNCTGATAQVYAEDLMIDNPVTIEQLIIWGIYWSTDTPVDTDVFRVRIHESVGGEPGTVVYDENDVSHSRAQTGVTFMGFNEWVYTMTLAIPTVLSPGWYWLEIYDDTGWGTDDFAWENGAPDPVQGHWGTVHAFEAPGELWYYETTYGEMSLQIIGSMDILWLSEDSTGGTVPAGECSDVMVTFASFGLEVDEHLANLDITSNDPDEPEIDVPVTLNVLEPVTGADFTWEPAEPYAWDAATFTGTVTSGSEPLTWDWDFGDGSTGSGQVTNYAYPVPGTYTVILTVSNGASQSVIEHSITVVEPFPDIVVTPEALASEQLADQVVTQTLEICNDGIGPLVWSLAESPPMLLLDQPPDNISVWTSDASCDACPTGAQVMAENFHLDIPAIVHQMIIWGVYYSLDTPVDIDFFRLRLHEYLYGNPGSVLYDEYNISHSRAQTGLYFYGLHEYVYTMTLAMPAALAPGDYWAEIYDDTGSGTDDFSWEAGILDPNNGIESSRSAFEAPGQEWSYFTYNYALQIIGTEDTPWLLEYPTNGSVQPGDCSLVDVAFNSASLDTGEYTATLDLTTNDQDDPIIEVPVTLYVEDPVVGASFIWEPLEPYAGDIVTFTGTVISGTEPFTWDWTFGDGMTGTGHTTTHSFSAGTYTITLTVGNGSSQEVVVHSITVLPPPCDPIEGLTFTWQPAEPYAAGTVLFEASILTGTEPVYTWDFGDGEVGIGITATHVYTAAGSYTVTLTAENACSLEEMVEVITIAGPCAPPAGAAFTWTPEDIFAGFEVTFAATVMTGTEPLTYDWLITDLITSTSDITGTGQAFTYAFDVTGTYTVTLTVSNPCGAAVPIVNFVVVTPPVYSAYLPATLKATGP